MGKMACVFPGQGAQGIGMGQDLFQTPIGKQALAIAGETLGEELPRLMREGPEQELQWTFNAQPAILLVSVVAWSCLTAAGVQADFLAGHSLGEYSAYVAADSIGLPEALRLVRKRGEYMQEASPEGQGMMAAILGARSEWVEQACQAASDRGVVASANYNCPGQIVISGEKEAVLQAMATAKELGAKRVVPLAVSGPFHSKLMQPAAERLAAVLNEVDWQEPRIPVIANIDALEVSRKERIVPTLLEQISGAVRWEQSIQYLAGQGVDTFVECGPGKVLSGLIKKIVPDGKILHIEDQASLEKSLAYLKESR
ncbi:MAG: ACP S-malonyltransferase [Peptococcaceae bacterium]|jgi:[acyl-carrier-protein] S-malonyltransferase|nr:ACP S-malonyltransferase [Peptococcaceae bacterium]